MAKDVAEPFSIESILADFSELPDPRSTINRIHLLSDILVISILAVIAGAEGPRGIGLWALCHEDWLRERLPLPGGLPSHDTIGRVLAALKPDVFQRCFQAWRERIIAAREKPVTNVVAIDGKTLRGSHDKRHGLGPLHLVSAWSIAQGVSLGQLATEAKSNEITAIPELIDQIDVKDCVVTIDAMGCQKSIAKKVIESHGDYVMTLKGNHSKLYKAVQAWVTECMDKDFRGTKAKKHRCIVNGHGRQDEHIYFHMPMPQLSEAEGWDGLRSLGVAMRVSQQGDDRRTDKRYYLSSLEPVVKRFANCVRSHWQIENTLHWCLDVTFNEDASRVRNRILAENMAWLKRFAISILKQVQNKNSIAMRRRMAGWNPNCLAEFLGIPA